MLFYICKRKKKCNSQQRNNGGSSAGESGVSAASKISNNGVSVMAMKIMASIMAMAKNNGVAQQPEIESGGDNGWQLAYQRK
jgi:hypothetical protein